MACYGDAMIDDPARPARADAVDAALRDQLAREEATAGTIAPILRYLLANSGNSLFSEEIVARVKGMLGDVVRQLLDGGEPDGPTEPREHPAALVSGLTEAIVTNAAMLRHLHALALEWQLTQRLQAQLALDPVLPPLLQALIASPDPATGGLAMQFLAAQARFSQAQRRMRLPLHELPADLLHGSLLALRTVMSEDEHSAAAAAGEAAIRAGYDEAHSRLGLIARLVSGMGSGAVAALAIGHAGAAIFLTALAIASGQERDLAALSTSDAQPVRLAFGLCAAGLKPSAVEEQLLAIHPDCPLPRGLDRIHAEDAAAFLSAGFPGS